MKKLIFFAIALLAVSLQSCNDDSTNINPVEKPENQVVFSDNMLSFNSAEEAEATISELLKMTEAERTKWYESKDSEFVSQESIFQSAVLEVEKLTTLSEADQFRKKYEPYLLFNDDPADEELYNPYLPSDQHGYSLICNGNGDVEIGGEIKNFNNISSVKETFYYKTSHAVETRWVSEAKNYLFSEVGKRKFWAESYRNEFDNRAYIKFTAHQKSFLGWNKYATTYHVKLLTHNGIDAWQNDNTSGPSSMVEYLIFQPGQELWTSELRSGWNEYIGTINSYFWAQGRVQATFRIFSRGTDVAGEGTLTLDLYGM